MADADDTKAALDDALRSDLAPMLNDDEIITAWIVVAGVRSIRGGGSVVTTSSGREGSDGPADWEIEGLLRRGLVVLNHPDGNDE